MNSNYKYMKKERKMIKSYSLYNKDNNKIFNSTVKLKNIKKLQLKKCLSFRQTLNNRFFKSLRNSWFKPKTTLFPKIIDKNTFNFSLKDENNDILKRTFNIIKGNKKHQQFTNIANRKEIAKKNAAKEFREKMKLIQSNLEIIKKCNLEEKKRMKELMMIRRVKKNEKQSVKKDKRNSEEREKYERKLNIKNDKIMNKYKEIMNKIKIKDNRLYPLNNFN